MNVWKDGPTLSFSRWDDPRFQRDGPRGKVRSSFIARSVCGFTERMSLSLQRRMQRRGSRDAFDMIAELSKQVLYWRGECEKNTASLTRAREDLEFVVADFRKVHMIFSDDPAFHTIKLFPCTHAFLYASGDIPMTPIGSLIHSQTKLTRKDSQMKFLDVISKSPSGSSVTKVGSQMKLTRKGSQMNLPKAVVADPVDVTNQSVTDGSRLERHGETVTISVSPVTDRLPEKQL